MKYLWRLANLGLLILIANNVYILKNMQMNFILKSLLIFFIVIVFIFINTLPMAKKKMPIKMQILLGGYELFIYALIGITLEIALTIYFLLNHFEGTETVILVIANDLMAGFIFFVVIMNGIIRLISTSSKLSIVWKVLLFFLWWVPIFNLFLIVKVCYTARSEYRCERAKEELNEVRKESEVCATKYPIVMVHGVFFRDWQLFNYWGRIPKELKRNGAKIFYGNQQSAATVKDSAEELRKNILKIIEENKCGKVNIIAHSKGGLDSRYAISCLGLDSYVASLTTVNSPHRGCKWVDEILKKTSRGLVNFVTKKYNAVFKKIGDKNPDFYPALCDLTMENCLKLNEMMPDKENVYYQSFTSQMSAMFSDGFPLSVSYYLAVKTDNSNDGLVGVESAKWGNFLGVLSTKRKRGISHGDIIDLRRQDIKGFDVREYYVLLAKNLKEMGF